MARSAQILAKLHAQIKELAEGTSLRKPQGAPEWPGMTLEQHRKQMEGKEELRKQKERDKRLRESGARKNEDYDLNRELEYRHRRKKG